MDAVDVIRTKRDGGALSTEQIRWFITAYTDGDVGDDQAAALLMAILFRGMAPDELSTWTQAMIDSGATLDLRDVPAPTVDKHSTGGVGDKISLILAPLVAACGAAVPMLSGRGLGHTGGTLDKLETIPGFRTDLSLEETKRVVAEVGCAIVAATSDLAPADRKLYALRDVTGTVESIPLIASSIMSKKIAEGTKALVLDVKVGSGAFLPDISKARELAQTMVGIGTSQGVATRAVLTDMESPLGRTAGNALEVAESLDVLRGGGPQDVIDVTLALAEQMLEAAGVEADPREKLANGDALRKYNEMVTAQGGDPNATLPRAGDVRSVDASESGYLRKLDARAVGIAAWRLGAGRARMGDAVSAVAGVVSLAKPGDEVTAGQPLLELHVDDPERAAAAMEALEGAIEIGSEPPEPRPLIIETIS